MLGQRQPACAAVGAPVRVGDGDVMDAALRRAHGEREPEVADDDVGANDVHERQVLLDVARQRLRAVDRSALLERQAERVRIDRFDRPLADGRLVEADRVALRAGEMDVEARVANERSREHVGARDMGERNRLRDEENARHDATPVAP